MVGKDSRDGLNLGRLCNGFLVHKKNKTKPVWVSMVPMLDYPYDSLTV